MIPSIFRQSRQCVTAENVLCPARTDEVAQYLLTYLLTNVVFTWRAIVLLKDYWRMLYVFYALF